MSAGSKLVSSANLRYKLPNCETRNTVAVLRLFRKIPIGIESRNIKDQLAPLIICTPLLSATTR